MMRTFTYLGVDPGDRWTGVGALEVRVAERRTQLRMSSFVVDGKDDTFKVIPLLTKFMNRADACDLCVELYHHRPIGHQSWKVPITAKVIGALEWTAHEYDVPIEFFRPGNPIEYFDGLKIRRTIEDWMTHWPRAEWDHALSGWRVLTMHLLHNHLSHWLLSMQDMNDARIVDPPEVDQGIVAAPRLQGWIHSSREQSPYEIDPEERDKIERAIPKD